MSPFPSLPFLRKDTPTSSSSPRRTHISKASISKPLTCRSSMDIPDLAPPRPHHLSNYSTYLDYKDYREEVYVEAGGVPIGQRLEGFEAEVDGRVREGLVGMGF